MINMNTSPLSQLLPTIPYSSNQNIIIAQHSTTSFANIEMSAPDRVHMVEETVEGDCGNCSLTADDTIMGELTPYPYTPTSEEIADYYQLEESLGENWSFRIACDLSFEVVSMDDNDNDDYKSVHNEDDSVTFFDDSHDEQNEENMSCALPEDIEVLTYTRRDNYVDDNTVSPLESFSRYEIF